MNNEIIITADRALDLARQINAGYAAAQANKPWMAKIVAGQEREIATALLAFEELNWFGMSRTDENLWGSIRVLEWAVERDTGASVTYWATTWVNKLKEICVADGADRLTEVMHRISKGL